MGTAHDVSAEKRDAHGKFAAGSAHTLDTFAAATGQIAAKTRRPRRTAEERETDKRARAEAKATEKAAKVHAREIAKAAARKAAADLKATRTAERKLAATQARLAKAAAHKADVAARKIATAAGRKTVTAFKREGLKVPIETAKLWNKHVGMSPKEFASRIAGNSGLTAKWGSVEGTTIGGHIGVSFTLRDGTRQVGATERSIDVENKTVNHGFFALDEGYQERGIGKEMLRSQVSTWQQIGLSGVKLFANVDVGGYAWAKYGFKPVSMDTFRTEVNLEFGKKAATLNARMQSTFNKLLASNDTQAAWAIADHPKGKEMLLGRSWHGALSFNDTKAMERFNAYVSR